MTTYTADTYAWISYFDGHEEYVKTMDENVVHTPVLVLAELSRVWTRRGINGNEKKQMFNFIGKKGVLFELSAESAVGGGELAVAERLPLADAIIYSYASEGEPLLTGDGHFKGKKNVLFLK